MRAAVVVLSFCTLAVLAEHQISAQDMEGHKTQQTSQGLFSRTVSESEQHLLTYAQVMPQ